MSAWGRWAGLIVLACLMGSLATALDLGWPWLLLGGAVAAVVCSTPDLRDIWRMARLLRARRKGQS